MIYKLIAVILLSTTLIGVAWGDTSELRFIYTMDQKVTGIGFFSSYQNVTAGNLRLNNLGYGAGSYDHESTLYAQKETRNNSFQDYYDVNERNIDFKEKVDLAYGEKTFNLGKSFKSGALRTQGKEETCIKNYATGVSMDALFDSTGTLSKDLSANLYWKWLASGVKNDPEEDYSVEQTGRTKLNVDATFTGKGHIGAAEVNGSRGVHRVNKLIDEDYLGSFAISKKMSHEFRYKIIEEKEDWLPCCFNGWNGMKYTDQKGFGKSTKGVFDCTCYKVPAQAEFPSV